MVWAVYAEGDDPKVAAAAGKFQNYLATSYGLEQGSGKEWLTGDDFISGDCDATGACTGGAVRSDADLLAYINSDNYASGDRPPVGLGLVFVQASVRSQSLISH